MASVRVFSALVKGFAKALNPWGLVQPARPPLRTLRQLLAAAETARPQPLAAFVRGFALKSASTVGRAGTWNGGARQAARLPLYGFVVGLAYFGDEREGTGDESSDVKAVAAALLLKQQKQDSRDVLCAERRAAAVRTLKDVTVLEFLGWGCSGGVFAASVSKDIGHKDGDSIALIADRSGHGIENDSDVADSDHAPPPAPAILSSRVIMPSGEHRATDATSAGSRGTGASLAVVTVVAAASVAAQPSDAISRVAEKTADWPGEDSVERVRQPLRRQWEDAAAGVQEKQHRCDGGSTDDDPSFAAIASSESFEVLSTLPIPDGEVERPLDVAVPPRHCMSDHRVSILHSSVPEDHSSAHCESSCFTIISDSLVVVPSCAPISSHLYTEASVVDAGSGPSTSVNTSASHAVLPISNDPAADVSNCISWPKQPTLPMGLPSVQKHFDNIEESTGERSFEILPESTSTAYDPLSPMLQDGSAEHEQLFFANAAVSSATTKVHGAITIAAAEQISPSQPKLPETLRAIRSAFPGSCYKESQDAAEERRVNKWQSDTTLPVRNAPKASGIACRPDHPVPMVAAVATPDGENRVSGTVSRSPKSSTSTIAIKMLFNSPRALKAVGEELLPLATGSFGHYTPLVRCGASHPNIVEMYEPFVDVVPDQLLQHLSRQSASLMIASPSGRLVTVFLPMKRYACTLYSYIRLRDDNASTKTACTTVQVHARLACQLFEGVAFLESVRVAHRDLKSENILLEPCGCTHDAATDAQRCCSPKLVISDFGHALVGLRLPYDRPQVSLGGNPAHRPPEILRALAGPGVVVDYSKSDAWAAGLIALEILTCGASRDRHLKHPERLRWLRQQQLLLMQHQRGANANRGTGGGTDGLRAKLCSIVESLLEADTSQRLSASDAANAVQLCLWLSDAVVEIALRRRAAAESLRTMVVGCIFSSSLMRGESHLRLSRHCRRRLGARHVCCTDVRLQLTFLERVDAKAVRTAACRLLCVH